MESSIANLPDWPEPPTNLVLSAECVEVWQVSTNLSNEALVRLEETLSTEEAQRLHNLRLANKRAEFTVARALMRKILGGLLHIDPRGIAFTTGAHGKPGIHMEYAGKPVHFNISHTRNRVLFAATLGV
jgi:4'-phosphopantetheinyl transferase